MKVNRENCYKNKLKNWFFLDMSLPLLVKYSDLAIKNKTSLFSIEPKKFRSKKNNRI